MSSRKPKPGPQAVAPPIVNPLVPPRLLRITDAAQYLSATYTFVETLIREKTVPSFIQGKRRVIDRVDLDAYIERMKEVAA